MKLRVLKAEGRANTQEIQVLNFTAGPQPTSVIDTFDKSGQQRCRLRKIHCGSVTALLFRAYKSPREPCYPPAGATQGSAACGASCATRLAQGRSASALCLLVSARERHFVPVSMAVCKGNVTKSWLFKNRTLIKQQVQYSLVFYVFPFACRTQPHSSPAVLFLLHVPCDVPTTEGTGRVLTKPQLPTALNQQPALKMSKSGVWLWLFTKPVRML